MIALICAFPSEVREFREKLAVKREFSYQCCSFVEGTLGRQAVLLAFSGRGGGHAREVAWLVLETYPVSLLVSTGLCTSLNVGVRSGDIAVYRQVLDGIPAAPPAESVINFDPRLLANALELDGRKTYRVVAVRGATIAESAAAGGFASQAQTSGVEVLDYASFPVCQLAAEKGFPFFCARVVSTEVAAHPASGADEAETNQAGRRLADFLADFVGRV